MVREMAPGRDGVLLGAFYMVTVARRGIGGGG
jgi:hypothetical protein